MTRPLVSVLLPCRGRHESTRRSLESLKLASDPTRIEVLVRCDDDDPETAQIMQEPWPFRIRTFVGPRGRGYEDLHLMYNELALAAEGTFLFLWNNDAIIRTPNWDNTLLPYDDGKLRYFRPRVTPDDQFLSFPIVHRTYIDCLRRYSPWAHNDTHVFNVLRPFFSQIHQDIDIRIHHCIDALLAEKDEVSIEGRSTWSATMPIRQTAEYKLELQQDRDKIAQLLCSQGHSASETAMDGLSLCIINRNDRDNVVRLVKEARAWVDEIVVLDTGSTDDSVAAARAAGADIVVERRDLLHEDGELRSFAEARNESYKLATKSWQLWLDTDDTLSDWSMLPKLVQQVRDARNRGQWGTNVSLWCDYVWSEDRSRCTLTLLRNRITHKDDFWRWVQPIHERLVCGHGDDLQIIDEKLRIIHLSSGPRNINDRNLRILQRWEAEDGTDENPEGLYFCLGVEHCNRQQYDLAFEYFNRMAGLTSEIRVSGVLNAGRCLMLQGKIREMRDYVRPFFKAAPHIVNFYWDAAYACLMINDSTMANFMMNEAKKATLQIENETTKFRDYVIEHLKSVHK